MNKINKDEFNSKLLQLKSKPIRPFTSFKAILSLLTIAQLTLATNQLIENSIIISLNQDWFQHPESK